jgi:tetratricopeptide (TPR) repeat protein
MLRTLCILFSLFSLFITSYSWAGGKAELVYNIKKYKQARERKEYKNAIKFSKEALHLGKSLFGDDHKHIATLSSNLAWLYRTEGNYGKAEQLYRDALAIRGKILGQEHPGTTKSLNNLYVTILGKTLGLNPKNSSISLSNLAKLYKTQGHYSKEDGIIIVGIPPTAASAYDIPVIDAKGAALRIRSALQLLQKRSPHSSAALKTLKKNGDIVIVYDPRFPLRDVSGSGATMASFFRNLFNTNASRNQPKVFPVVVSRYIVKWKTKELAFALAHELLGHGMQHQRGRLKTMQETDRECEARLYQEIVHQDLGIDKHNRIMVSLRQDLESRWCAPFRKYMNQKHKADMKLWQSLNPDIPRLLSIFEKYLLATSRG